MVRIAIRIQVVEEARRRIGRLGLLALIINPKLFCSVSEFAICNSAQKKTLMSRRDSDSKRRHSKFDQREPSPKRYRRDGKQDRAREREKERGRERVTTNGERKDNNSHMDRDERKPLPLPPPPPLRSKHEPADDDAAHKKTNPIDPHHELSKNSSQQPRSRTYHQHDEQGSARQVGRSAGRREAGGKVSTQENNEGVDTNLSREKIDEKSQPKLAGNFQRRDGFPERKDGPPSTVRKRPAFREKKIPMESGNANAAVTVTVKSSHTEHLPERNERKEERSNNPSHLDRPEKQIAEDRAPNKREVRRDGFSSRVRYGGSVGNNNYRGRDRFNGGQGFHTMKNQTEKWKHDLYQEVSKDPIPKNEEDQIAKLEALLAS